MRRAITVVEYIVHWSEPWHRGKLGGAREPRSCLLVLDPAKAGFKPLEIAHGLAARDGGAFMSPTVRMSGLRRIWIDEMPGCGCCHRRMIISLPRHRHCQSARA